MNIRKRNFLIALCEAEAKVSGFNTDNLFGNEMLRYGVSGFDPEMKRLIEAAPEYAFRRDSYQDCYIAATDIRSEIAAEGVPSEDAKILESLYLRIVENTCKAAAWSLGDVTRLPFLQHESMGFRVSVKRGKQDSGVESRLYAGGVDIFLPQDLFGIDRAIKLTRYAVIGSFMMHDATINGLISEGRKTEAAAAAITYMGLSEAILTSLVPNHSPDVFGAVREKLDSEMSRIQFETVYDKLPADIHCERDEPLVSVSKSTSFPADISGHGLLIDMFSSVYSEAIDFFRNEVGGLNSYRKQKTETIFSNRLNSICRHAKNSYSAIASKESETANTDGMRNIFAHMMQVIEQLKEKEPGADEGEGQGEGQGGAAESVLSLIMSEQGQSQGEGEAQGEGQGEGEAQGEGQGEAQEEERGEGQDNETRKRMIGRFASTEAGRKIIEMLSDQAEEKAAQEESKIDWQQYLVGALLRSTGIDRVYNWARPNRRHIGNDIYLPGFRRRKVRRLAVLIDESGSIDMEALMEFNPELIRVIDIVNPEGVDIFHFSTTVEEETLSQGEAWEAKRLLTGGTRFSVAYDAVATHISNGQVYDAVIVFTDMEDSGYYGIRRENAMKHLPEGMDWYFVTYGNNCPQADFGTQISITTGEIQEHG